MKDILTIVLLSLFVIVATWWMCARAEKAEAAYLVYEACVEREYGMLPSTYYQLNGFVPECE